MQARLGQGVDSHINFVLFFLLVQFSRVSCIVYTLACISQRINLPLETSTRSILNSCKTLHNRFLSKNAIFKDSEDLLEMSHLN